MRASRREGLRYLGLFIFVACAMGVSATWAGPREQAKRIHDRLVGVPPAPAVLDSMEAKVAGGDAVGPILRDPVGACDVLTLDEDVDFPDPEDLRPRWPVSWGLAGAVPKRAAIPAGLR